MVVKWNFSNWVVDERICVAIRVWVVGRVVGVLFCSGMYADVSL